MACIRSCCCCCCYCWNCTQTCIDRRKHRSQRVKLLHCFAARNLHQHLGQRKSATQKSEPSGQSGTNTTQHKICTQTSLNPIRNTHTHKHNKGEEVLHTNTHTQNEIVKSSSSRSTSSSRQEIRRKSLHFYLLPVSSSGEIFIRNIIISS